MSETVFDGFAMSESCFGVRIECLMPPLLKESICAEFWSRGSISDAAHGDPSSMRDALADSLPGGMIAPIQVHGSAIMQCRAIWALPNRPKADGIHLDPAFDLSRSLTASLRFADCSPVLIASARPHPWAMVLHSGFVGTGRRILVRAVEMARRSYLRLDCRDLFIWLGPAIGRCCYTRMADDPSTVEAVGSWHDGSFTQESASVRFDLHEELSMQAMSCGVPAANIYRFPLCTKCNNDVLYSFRAGDRLARTILLVRLK